MNIGEQKLPFRRPLFMRLLYHLSLLFPLLLASCVRAQDVPPRLKTGYAPLDDKLSRLVTVDEHALSAKEARALDNPIFSGRPGRRGISGKSPTRCPSPRV
jgi:hypothetical protein